METVSGRAAVFLDRDGTITRYLEYCLRPEDVRLLPGVGRAIQRLNQSGLLVVVVTNQSAVGRGWLTLEQLDRIHTKMRRQLKQAGASVDAIYVCPHHPGDGCDCLKPGIGMFTRAAKDLGVSLEHSYMVGDRQLDIRSGRSAGGTTILVQSGHPPEPPDGMLPDHEAATLREAVAWIFQQEERRRVLPGRRASPPRRVGRPSGQRNRTWSAGGARAVTLKTRRGRGDAD